MVVGMQCVKRSFAFQGMRRWGRRWIVYASEDRANKESEVVRNLSSIHHTPIRSHHLHPFLPHALKMLPKFQVAAGAAGCALCGRLHERWEAPASIQRWRMHIWDALSTRTAHCPQSAHSPASILLLHVVWFYFCVQIYIVSIPISVQGMSWGIPSTHAYRANFLLTELIQFQ